MMKNLTITIKAHSIHQNSNKLNKAQKHKSVTPKPTTYQNYANLLQSVHYTIAIFWVLNDISRNQDKF